MFQKNVLSSQTKQNLFKIKQHYKETFLAHVTSENNLEISTAQGVVESVSLSEIGFASIDDSFQMDFCPESGDVLLISKAGKLLQWNFHSQTM